MTTPSPSPSSVPIAFQQAVRTLLDAPLLTEGMDGFRETYAWRMELRTFFARVAALTVQIGPGVLRLVLPPPHPEGGRAWDGVKSPRAAALVAWVLWYHEYLGVRLGEVRQFSLAEVASAITANPEAGGIDFSLRHNRFALLQAVRTLRDLGALRILDEDTRTWDSDASEVTGGGALLEFTPAAPYLISAPPTLPATPAQRAARALLCGPALTRAQDEQAFRHLNSPELDELERTLGWSAELHAQYATLHREGLMHGVASRWTPGRSVTSSAALLLVNAVRREISAGTLTPTAQGRVTLTRTRLYTLLDELRAHYRARWGGQGKLSTEKLMEEVLTQWREWGGIASEDSATLTLEPHLARFHAAYEDETPPQTSKRRGRGGRPRKNEQEKLL